MKKFIEKIPDLFKFLSLLVIYSTTIAWWAATQQANLEHAVQSFSSATIVLDKHIETENKRTHELILLSNNVKQIQALQTKQTVLLDQMVKDNLELKFKYDNINRRLDRLEQ